MKIKQKKVSITLTKKLIRVDDGKVVSGDIKFIEYIPLNNKLHNKPEIGYGCIVDPQYGIAFTWMTTPIVEVISNNEFKTKNSHYKIE